MVYFYGVSAKRGEKYVRSGFRRGRSKRGLSDWSL